MHPLLYFYSRTWWLWLAFVALFITLGIYVSAIFWILIPGLLIYSIYFGMVRSSEEAALPPPRQRGFEVQPVSTSTSAQPAEPIDAPTRP